MLLSKSAKTEKPPKSTDTKKAYKALHKKVGHQLLGLPKPELEVLFHPVRKWRFDYAWTDHKVALEVHGGTFAQGRHTRGKGFGSDREKMNEAQLLGWIVIECSTDNLHLVRDWIERALLINSKQK